MSERSVRCPECTFSFCHLFDAGDYRAYVCMACGWSKPTSDTRPGNRPPDVCALCDGPIDLTGDVVDLHKFFGEEWVWGAGSRAAHIPIHASCADAIRAYERTGTIWTDGCSCPPRVGQGLGRPPHARLPAGGGMSTITEHYCGHCKAMKPVEDFYTRKRASGEVVPRNTCKTCWSEQTLSNQRANPERYREYGRTSRAKTTRRERALREKFGMTQEDWDRILAEQGGACAICQGASGDEMLHGDHNHDTGEFRGILCGLCNRMLGQGQDDPERLIAGAAYLLERA